MASLYGRGDGGLGCGVTRGWSGAKSVQIWSSGSRSECHHCLSQTQLLVENEMGVNRPPPLEQFGGSEGSVWMVSSLRQVSVGVKWFISGVGGNGQRKEVAFAQ